MRLSELASVRKADVLGTGVRVGRGGGNVRTPVTIWQLMVYCDVTIAPAEVRWEHKVERPSSLSHFDIASL